MISKKKKEKIFLQNVSFAKIQTLKCRNVDNYKSNKKRPSALLFLKNMMTLSDRLHLAGIKEFKPQSGVKPTNNLYKKRKSSFKITTVKKPQNVPADSLLKESSTKQTLKSKKIILGNSPHPSTNLNNTKKRSAEETLWASLDFINDCQVYKKKFFNVKEDLNLNNQEKKIASSTECKQYDVKKEESKNLASTRVSKEIELAKSCIKEDFLFHKNKSEKSGPKEAVNDELNHFTEDNEKILQEAEPVITKMSLGDVAKIDKKYLESVLTLATNSEAIKKKSVEKNEIGKEKAKKSTRKSFSKEQKLKETAISDLISENKTYLSKNFQNNMKNSGAQLRKDPTSTRIVRDLTKSEVRIQLRDNENNRGVRNSEEIKIEKEIVHSKTELADNRKKRKLRNKILKSNYKEVIEIPFSSEISKAEDVKELWRRENQKKSENSLTSHSSCTIPETDENPKWKNLRLQSYRILHKLVEEEINKICKKSESKNNTEEIKNNENIIQKIHENKAEIQKDSLKLNNIFNKLNLPSENSVGKKKALLVEKKLMLAQNLKNYSIYEGEKNKSEMVGLLDKDSVKKPNEEVKHLQQTGTKCKKVPEQIIQDWSILNRLEQAFIALGSSNFQNENTLNTKKRPEDNFTQESKNNEKASQKNGEQKKIKSQNQITQGTLSTRKIPRPLSRTKVSDNESFLKLSSKEKTEHVKSSFAVHNYGQSKEKIKLREPRKVETSNINQNNFSKKSLLRKQTFNSASLKDTSFIQPRSSNISKKIYNKHTYKQSDKIKKRPMQKQEPEKNEKPVVKNELLPRNESIEKGEEKPKLTLKNQVNPTAKKRPQSTESTKSGIPRSIKKQKQPCEKVVEEEITASYKQKMSEKEELKQKNSNENSVKERSILSVCGNQQDTQLLMKKLQSTGEKSSSNFLPALNSSTGDAQKEMNDVCQKPMPETNDNSYIYCMYKNTSETSDYNLDDKAKKNSKIINYPKQNMSNSKNNLLPESNLSQKQFCQQSPVLEKYSQDYAHSSNLSLWEKDIRRYREIVTDIMSQYKRIDGFLKQSDRLGISSNMSTSDKLSKNYTNEKSSKSFDESQILSIQEYRRKVMEEYQTLPFFEYKQLKGDKNIKLEEARKNNLLVVSDISKEMDFDVKDYQPKITKVLDSQIYVDKESLFQQNDPEKRCKDKKSSLPEIMFCHNGSLIKEPCLKSYSLPKTFSLSGGEGHSVQYNNQNPKC